MQHILCYELFCTISAVCFLLLRHFEVSVASVTSAISRIYVDNFACMPHSAVLPAESIMQCSGVHMSA